MNESFTVNANGSHEVSFAARNIFVQNDTGKWLYVTIGGQQIPDANSNDMAIAPFTQVSQPISPPTQFFAFGIGTKFLPTSTGQGGSIVVTFDEIARSPVATTISTPGATYAPLWVWARGSFPIFSTPTLLVANPGPGNHIQIFKFMITYGGNSTFQEFVLSNAVPYSAGTFMVSLAPGESGYQKTVSTDFGNGGIAVASNTPLYFYNLDTATQGLFVGVQYSII